MTRHGLNVFYREAMLEPSSAWYIRWYQRPTTRSTDQKRPNNKRSRKGNVFSRGARLPVSAAGGFSFASCPPTATATAIETR